MFECDLLVVAWQADRGVARLHHRLYRQSVEEAFQQLVTRALGSFPVRQFHSFALAPVPQMVARVRHGQSQ